MEGDENYEDIEESRRDSPCNNRNIIFVSALKMIFVDNPKTKAALKTQFTLMQQIRSTRKTMERQSLYAAHSS